MVPPATSTPLPPLKPKYRGFKWPIMAKMAARYTARYGESVVLSGIRVNSQRPMHTASTPLSTSPKAVSAAAFLPKVRSMLVMPAAPLPYLRTSSWYKNLLTRIPVSMLPSRYACTADTAAMRTDFII